MAGKRPVLARMRDAWRGARAGWVDGAQPQAPTPWRPEHDVLGEVLERSPDCVVQTDAQGVITYLNPAARGALGLGPAAPVAGLRLSAFLTPATRRQFETDILPALLRQGVWVGEASLSIGQKSVPFSHMLLAHRGAHGQPVRYSAVMRDISSDVEVRQQGQRQVDVLKAITEAIPATVVIVDAQGRYRYVNQAFQNYVGREASQILGRTAIEVLGTEEVARRKPYMIRAVGGEAVEFTLDYPGPDGTRYLALSCIPLTLDGVVDGFVGISQDVTHQRREQDRLSHLAERDPLTGLLNRAGFESRVECKVWSGEGPSLAMLYIDLDHFKPVNDRYGHQTGDQLLQMFSKRLSETVRSSDVVARLGGDEFAILLEGVPDLTTARRVADKVLAAASQPFEIEGRRIQVSASVGVSMARGGEQDWRALLHQADQLLYRAKKAGRGQQAAQASRLEAETRPS